MHRAALILLLWAKGLMAAEGYIDTHNHLVPASGLERVVEIALLRMDAAGIRMSLIMPMPQTMAQQHRLLLDDILPIARLHPDRFAVLGGGGSLNVMIQQAIDAGQVSQVSKTALDAFDAAAGEIIRKGAVGFGEMTAEHFSMNPEHPYVSAPPDHPLFLRLADLAAKHQVVIDLHMEAIPREMPCPERLRSPPNPKTLRPNIPAFERLLAHNRKARIVWVHLGWDNTGARTPELTRRLLQKHSNLFISIRVPPAAQAAHVNPTTFLVGSDGGIRSEWRALFEAYPDRFVLGADEIIRPSGGHSSEGSMHSTVDLLRQLDKTLRRKIGSENARTIYRLTR